MTWTKNDFTISGTFSGNFNTGNFVSEITASAIEKNIEYVQTDGDIIYLNFSSELTQQELDVLTGLVGNHNSNTPEIYTNIVSLTPKKFTVKEDYWFRVKTFRYEGSIKSGTIKKICAIGHMDGGVTNFSIKIYDNTNKNVIAEKEFTDTVEDSTLEFTTIENVPENPSTIEISVKKSGGSKKEYCYIEDICFYF